MTNETTKLKILGRNIFNARRAKGLSQNQLAEKLDISREHLAKLETGKRRISLKLLFLLPDILEISESELLDFRDIQQK